MGQPWESAAIVNKTVVDCWTYVLGPVHTSNNVEATFDFVEATFDTVERIVQLVAFDNVASTLLLVWTGL